jgi:regulator of nucleoside diphosphate kinase
MNTSLNCAERPPIHILASESDLIASLALSSEQRTPVVSAMLLEEIERAQLHDPDTMPPGHAGLNSIVTFVDEKAQKVREVQLVLPAQANITENRLSILTPMGAALYGLAADHTIEWPDIHGNHRPIRVLRVVPPEDERPSRPV